MYLSGCFRSGFTFNRLLSEFLEDRKILTISFFELPLFLPLLAKPDILFFVNEPYRLHLQLFKLIEQHHYCALLQNRSIVLTLEAIAFPVEVYGVLLDTVEANLAELQPCDDRASDREDSWMREGLENNIVVNIEEEIISLQKYC